MDGSWLLEQLTLYSAGAGLWLALSFLLAALTSGVMRFVAPDLERLVRVVRWVQLPYIGLILGGLSPRLMGLTEIDWASGLRVGVLLLAGLLTLLVMIRIGLHTDEELPQGTPLRRRASSLRLIESSAQEFHWCFLRGAVWELLLSLRQRRSNQPSIGPSGLAPRLRCAGIAIHRRQTSDRLITALALATTSTLFLFTRNFWLCWLLHLSIRVIFLWSQPGRQNAA